MQQYWYVFQHKGWSFKLVRLCSCSPKTARPYNTVQPLTFFADSFIVYLFFMFFEILLRDDYMRLTDLNSVNSIVPLIPFFICILKFASHKEIFWKDIKIDVFYFSYPFLVLYFRGNPGGCNLGDERECNLNPLHFLLCFIF